MTVGAGAAAGAGRRAFTETFGGMLGLGLGVAASALVLVVGEAVAETVVDELARRAERRAAAGGQPLPPAAESG